MARTPDTNYTLTQFLSLILATDAGYPVLTTKVLKGDGGAAWKNVRCNNLSDLEGRAFLLDQKENTTVYFACATYHPISKDWGGQSREASSVAAVKCLWADIDIKDKPGHHRTPGEALKALRKLCKGTGLPIPIVVVSGRGLHTYWPFTAFTDQATWKRAALALKAACDAHGLGTSNKPAFLKTCSASARPSPSNGRFSLQNRSFCPLLAVNSLPDRR